MTSLLGTFSVGTLGLEAQSGSIDTISNNIANASTVGFKSALAHFQELVDSDNAFSYAAGGDYGGSLQNIQQTGAINQTTSATDLAISGEGFFAVKADPTDTTVSYTRSGSFTADKNGNLVNGAGYYLQGWPVDANGDLSAGLSTASVDEATAVPALQTVNVNQLNDAPVATTNVSIVSNLTASQAAYTGTYMAGSVNMASGAVAPQFSGDFSVVDSNGVSHQLTAGFLKTSNNTWNVEIYGSPSDTKSGDGNSDGQVAAGVISFNSDGTLASVSSSLSTITPAWQDGDASTPIAINWGTAGAEFGTPGATTIGSSNGIEQLSTAYSFNDTQNGSVSGTLSNIAVTADGYVTGTYSDGTVRDLYKIPLATFRDPDALTSQSGSIFTESLNSGAANFFQPSTTGTASIESDSLEASNVDISSELTNLIVAQQSYDTNSKIISTTDTMLSDAIQMVV